jgi:hypothetical protein
LTPTNAICNGGNMSISAAITGTPLNDLQIQIDAAGWNTVAATPFVFNGLMAASHTITIRRITDNTCTVNKSASVSQPDALDLTLTPTNASCNGGNMSISAAITGTPLNDLQIQIDAAGWVGVAATPVVFNGLTSGSHTITLRRITNNTCTVSKSASVSQPDALDLTLTPTNPS